MVLSSSTLARSPVKFIFTPSRQKPQSCRDVGYRCQEKLCQFRERKLRNYKIFETSVLHIDFMYKYIFLEVKWSIRMGQYFYFKENPFGFLDSIRQDARQKDLKSREGGVPAKILSVRRSEKLFWANVKMKFGLQVILFATNVLPIQQTM